MPSKSLGWWLAVAALWVATCAHAENRWCSGTLDTVLIYANGDVLILGTWRNDFTRLCNVKGDVGTVDTVTCSLWASYAEQAVEKQLPFMVYYSSIVEDCSTLKTYALSPVPGYVRVLKPSVP